MYNDILNKLIDTSNISYELLIYINNDEFQCELVDFSFHSINYILKNQQVNKFQFRSIMILLTYIALRYYNGSFWKHVRTLLEDRVNDFPMLEARIRDLILGRLVDMYGCERRHSQVPVMFSILPFKYAQNYYEFVHDIYVKNLDCSLSGLDIYEELENVFNSIKNKLTYDDDSFNYSFDTENVKVYKLLKSTKNIIKTGNRIDELRIFTVEMLKKLDAYYNGRKTLDNYYFDESFNEWLSTHPQIDINQRKRSSQIIKSKFPYYYLDKEKYRIYLSTPVRRVYGDYNKDKFVLRIVEDNNIIYETKSLVIKALLGGYEIDSIDYLISNPLSKIKCQLFYDSNLIYDSKDYLYREYMIFNEKDEITYKNRDYNGLAYFVYRENNDENIQFLYDSGNYKIGFSNVSSSAQYHIDNQYISFSSQIRSGIIGEYNKDIELKNKDNNLKIYNDIKQLVFVMQNKDLQAYKLKINDIMLNEQENIIKTIQKDNSIIKYNWSTDMNSGLYKVELLNIKTNKIVNRYIFLYDPCFHTKETLISDYKLQLNYSGSFALLSKKNEDLSAIELNINYINDNKKKYYLFINNKYYQVHFNCNVPYYYIDDENYSSIYYPLKVERLNIDSNLYFVVNNCDNVAYKIGNILKPLKLRNKDNLKYIDAGQLLSIKSIKEITILFRNGDVELYTLKVYYDSVYDEERSYYVIDPKNSNIEFKCYINGVKLNKDVYLKVMNGYNVIYNDKINLMENSNIVNVNFGFCKLKYQVYQYSEQYRGLKKVTIPEVLYESEIDYYSYKGLMGKYIPVYKLVYEINNRKITRLPNNLFIRLTKELDEYAFMGYIYTIENNRVKSFNRIDELKIVLSSMYKENNCNLMDANIYLYYSDDDESDPQIDYLQYNNSSNSVLNGANSTSPEIKKYILKIQK